MLISAIIPCYNVKEQKMTRMIESILVQTHNDIQLIFVDDGSTDDTLYRLKKHANRLFTKRNYKVDIITKVHNGCASAINEGIKHIQGDYLCFIDSDDILEKNYFSIMHDAIICSKADWVVCNAVRVYNEDVNSILSPIYLDEPIHFFKRVLLLDIEHVVWTSMIKRSFFQSTINDLHENMGSQEWQILLPISYKCDPYYIDKPLYRYVYYDDSLFHSKLNSYYDYRSYVEMLMDSQQHTLEKIFYPQCINSEIYNFSRIGNIIQLTNHQSPVLTNSEVSEFSDLFAYYTGKNLPLSPDTNSKIVSYYAKLLRDYLLGKSKIY